MLKRPAEFVSQPLPNSKAVKVVRNFFPYVLPRAHHYSRKAVKNTKTDTDRHSL